MKRIGFWSLISFLCLAGNIVSLGPALGAEQKGEYLVPGDVKEGWNVFALKKCSACHSIWGEGGKEGPDLGTLPESYVSQSQLAALMWNHWPGMWGKMEAKKISPQKMTKKEMADLFAFLYFLRYMDEPGNPRNGKALMESKHCSKCHPVVKEGAKGDLSVWGMYINPILWAQMMWNHAPQMEQEMKKGGLVWTEFKGNEMVDLIAYIRSLNTKAEKVYLSPGNLQNGKKLFAQKGCIQCHSPRGELDLSKKKDFPRTLGQLAGMMWNHSPKMWKGMEEKGMERPTLSSQEMADLVAYLFSTRYFDEPGDPEKGKYVFIRKQCNLCHPKGAQTQSLSVLKGQISPIFMAQTMWNHGPGMLEKMRKAKVPWSKIDGKEMADLMEYLNQGMP
jgi:mono/diheme cytochrome c family protein